MDRAIKIEDQKSEIEKLKEKVRNQARQLVKLRQQKTFSEADNSKIKNLVGKLESAEKRTILLADLLKSEVVANEQLQAIIEASISSGLPPEPDWKKLVHRSGIAKNLVDDLLQGDEIERLKDAEKSDRFEMYRQKLADDLQESLELKAGADNQLLQATKKLESLDSDVRCLLRIKERLENDKKQADRNTTKVVKEKEEVEVLVEALKNYLRLAEDALETTAEGFET